ncbi:hypothetical protein ACFWN1_08375 [Streptomyces sp. NPDC058459]
MGDAEPVGGQVRGDRLVAVAEDDQLHELVGVGEDACDSRGPGRSMEALA